MSILAVTAFKPSTGIHKILTFNPELTPRQRINLEDGSIISSIAYSPDESLAAGLESGNVLIIDRNENQHILPTNSGVLSVAYSPEHGSLAAGLENGN